MRKLLWGVQREWVFGFRVDVLRLQRQLIDVGGVASSLTVPSVHTSSDIVIALVSQRGICAKIQHFSLIKASARERHEYAQASRLRTAFSLNLCNNRILKRAQQHVNVFLVLARNDRI